MNIQITNTHPKTIPGSGPARLTQARAIADAWLAPYSLSCKTLLGIVGIIMLVVVGALSFKTWILPTWSQPGG